MELQQLNCDLSLVTKALATGPPNPSSPGDNVYISFFYCTGGGSDPSLMSQCLLLVSTLSCLCDTVRGFGFILLFLLLFDCFLSCNQLLCVMMCFPVKEAVFDFFQKSSSPNRNFENLKFWKILSLFFTFNSTKTPLLLFSVCVGRSMVKCLSFLFRSQK